MIALTKDVASRLTLLCDIPLFSRAPISKLAMLTYLFKEVSFEKSDVIVLEGDQVDSIFIIVSGEAEVSKQNQVNDMKDEVIAKLHAGEAIGLSPTGFYSTTGVRTATVKAITPLVTLKLGLVEFRRFLAENEHFNTDMLKSANEMLRQNFIKRIEPFQKIPQTLLKEIADNLEERKVSAGAVIIQQGSVADCCYLLRSGCIDLVLSKVTGGHVLLESIDKPGSIFGETALLTNCKRNSSVVAREDCQLYVLPRELFQKLTESSLDISSPLSNLMMERYCPVPVKDVTVHRQQNSEWQTIVVLKQEERGLYFKTTEEGWFIWSLLNGEFNISDLATEYYYKYHTLAIDSITNLIRQLMIAGFVEKPSQIESANKDSSSFAGKLFEKLNSYFTVGYSVRNIDEKLTKLYERIGFVFYSPLLHLLKIIVASAGLVTFVLMFPMIEMTLKSAAFMWMYLLGAYFVSCLFIPLHELAHAMRTKSLGRQIHRYRLGWKWVIPTAFTDTADMWLSDRKSRIKVNMAGVCLNIVAAGLLSIMAWQCKTGYPDVAVFLWMIACINYVMAYLHLNVLFDSDGYAMLENYFDVSNLRSKAVTWIARDVKSAFMYPALLRNSLPEVIYSLLVLGFVIGNAVTAYLLFSHIIVNLLPTYEGYAYIYPLRWAFSLAILLSSIMWLYHKVKSHFDVF